MASNNSTRDGLGFEEVNQASQTEIVSGTNIYGTVGSFVGTRITNISSTTISGTSIVNSNGLIKSVGVGSPISYGAMMQAGTVVTSAGSAGTIVFGTPFATAGWYAVLTAGSSGGVNQAYVSGVRNVSGAAIVGGPSITYNWVAVGL